MLAVKLAAWLFTISSVAIACQPTPTTTQQQVRTFVADSPIDIPRLINVEPSRVPIAPIAPVRTVFDLLNIPLPPSILVETPKSTEEPESTPPFTEEPENATSNEPESFGSSRVFNGTESSENLIKDLADAEKSVISTFSEIKSKLESESTLQSKTEPKVDVITTSRPALKLFAAPVNEEDPLKCNHATITAITIMPYDDRLVGVDLDKLHQQVSLLETYTQRKLSSFGEFSEEVTNIDGKFALRYNIKAVTNCSELRNFATKAVSYSREIERIQYSCMCQPIWIIAKRKSPMNINF